MERKFMQKKLELKKQTLANLTFGSRVHRLDDPELQGIAAGGTIGILTRIIRIITQPVEPASASCAYEGCGSGACDGTNQCGTSACE